MDHSAHEHEVGFLFHPMLVHFPIAFYFLEFLLLVFWVRKHDEQYLRFARFSFVLAYLSMILAMAAGLRDVGGISNIRGAVRSHVFGAASVFVFYTIRALLWRGVKEGFRYRWTHVLGALIGNVLVGITGYFGGALVFD